MPTTTTQTPGAPEHTGAILISRRSAMAMSGALAGGLCAAASRAQPASGSAGADDAEPTPAMVAFVLRHCETGGGDETSDPVLSRAGQDRAARVGAMLRSVGVRNILHTPTARARLTAMEISRAIGVGPGSYDPLDAGPVTQRMVRAGGVWIIIGHSNTVPELVRKLGGDPSADVLPESVYDRLYVVVRAGAGVMTMLLHSA